LKIRIWSLNQRFAEIHINQGYKDLLNKNKLHLNRNNLGNAKKKQNKIIIAKCFHVGNCWLYACIFLKVHSLILLNIFNNFYLLFIFARLCNAHFEYYEKSIKNHKIVWNETENNERRMQQYIIYQLQKTITIIHLKNKNYIY